MKHIFNLLLLSTTMIIFVKCTPEPTLLEPVMEFGSLPFQVEAPLDNELSQEKIKLGKLLFYDPVLSGNMDVSCASCHHPAYGYGDGMDFSNGVGGEGLGPDRQGGFQIARNAPTIINSGFNGIDHTGTYSAEEAVMFWDNRTKSLEEQAWGPMHSREEMRGDAYDLEATKETITNRLNGIPEYKALFQIAFRDSLITPDKVVKAIASFERSLVSNNSRFDQYMRGNEKAMSDLEIRGMYAFVEAGCANCHNGPMFSDYKLHNLGSPENGLSKAVDLGDGQGQFRTPTLRNVSLTGPYMHNGVFQTLEEVISFYRDLGDGKITSDFPLSENIEGTFVGIGQINAIVAFMESLTDDSYDKTVPEKVPSGLEVGGRINR